jgi:hypothetical protein
MRVAGASGRTAKEAQTIARIECMTIDYLGRDVSHPCSPCCVPAPQLSSQPAISGPRSTQQSCLVVCDATPCGQRSKYTSYTHSRLTVFSFSRPPAPLATGYTYSLDQMQPNALHVPVCLAQLLPRSYFHQRSYLRLRRGQHQRPLA